MAAARVAPPPTVTDAGHVVLNLVFDYFLELSPGREIDPSVDLFLTTNVSETVKTKQLATTPKTGDRSIHRGVARFDGMVFALNQVDSTSPQAAATLKMVGASYAQKDLRPSRVGAGQNDLLEPRDYEPAIQSLGEANLMFNMFAMGENKHSELCRNQAGVAAVPLAVLFGGHSSTGMLASLGRALSGDPSAKKHRYRLVHPMMSAEISGNRMEPAETDTQGRPVVYADKGWIEIVPSLCSIFYRGRPIQEFVKKWTIIKLPTSPFEDYISRTEREFGPDAIEPTYDALTRLDTFAWTTSTCVLPTASFCDRPKGKTGAAYFINAANLAMQRMEITRDHVLAWRVSGPNPDRNDCRMATYFLATVISLGNQYNDYIGDQVEVKNVRTGEWVTKPVECFYNSRIRDGAGDCEEGGLEFMIEFGELQRLVSSDPVIKLLQEVAGVYYLFMTLTGISGQEINVADPSADIGSHMNAMLINKGEMKRWADEHENYTGNKVQDDCDQHMATPEELRRAAFFIPCCVLEGTGPLNPNGVEEAEGDPKGEEITGNLINSSRYLSERMREMFRYSTKSGKSSFYVALKAMMTDSFLKEGCGLSMWTITQAKPRPGQAKGQAPIMTAGVPFADVASSAPGIMAVARPAFTKSQIEQMRHCMLNMHPTPSLQAPDESIPAPRHVQIAREQADYFEEQMKLLVAQSGGRYTRDSFRGERCAKYKHFDEQRVFLNELLTAIRSEKNYRLVHFRMKQERVSHTHGGYWFYWYWA